MAKRYDSTKHWYAIHTYSGYEEKVAESIRQRADSLDMGDKIFQVLVPKEKMIEIKNGKPKKIEKKTIEKMNTARVSRQVSRRLGQLTWRTSRQELMK